MGLSSEPTQEAIADLKSDVKAIQTEIETLSKRVDKHNNFAERTPVLEEQIKVISHRISDLEKQVNK